MSTATAVNIAAPEQEALSEGELRAWRGLFRAHACLAKRLDAQLEAAHHLPMTSYEVLHCLQGLRGRFTMLVVEQNLDFLARLAGRTYTLRAGRFEAS